MAIFVYWYQSDTSAWWANSPAYYQHYQRTVPAKPSKPLTVAAYNRLMLARARTLDRPVNSLARSVAAPCQPRLVRCARQRAGSVGFARLGGRRPL